MISEEMQKAMEFIVNQQAQLTATVGAVAESRRQTDSAVRALLAVTETQAGEIKDLRQSVQALNESVQTIDRRQREADERTRRTDERLDALITTVERYISERRGRVRKRSVVPVFRQRQSVRLHIL